MDYGNLNVDQEEKVLYRRINKEETECWGCETSHCQCQKSIYVFSLLMFRWWSRKKIKIRFVCSHSEFGLKSVDGKIVPLLMLKRIEKFDYEIDERISTDYER